MSCEVLVREKINMSKLTKSLATFDENDMRAMDEALKKFADYKKASKTGLPDFSPQFGAYIPILSFALFALLKSQAAMEKLTRWIVWLTVVLAVLAGIQVWLILK